jgi:ketosteroid isomerase-like protein
VTSVGTRTRVDVDLGMIKSRFRHARGAVIACFLFNMCACSPAAIDTPVAVVNDATTAIPAGLTASAEAWNNADLPGHIRPYADSATFMGGNGPIQGRDRVGESLARSFWRDGKPKQQLSFDRIEVRPLGDRHALATGHFVLTGGGEADRSGWFSLTWEKTASGWQILHDHSS